MWQIRPAWSALGAVAAILLSDQAAAADDPLWNPEWRRADAGDYVMAAVLNGSAFAVRFGVDLETAGGPNWRSGILFDDWGVEHLLVKEPGPRSAFNLSGDIVFGAAFAWSLIDPVAAGLLHQDADLTAQMIAMNAQTFGVFASMLWVTQLAVRRQRPLYTLCDDAGAAARYDIDCEPRDNVSRSFAGGHVGVLAIATSLTCLHHTNMPLWGGGVPDALPCGTGVAATAFMFAARTASGSHYLSDNLLGLTLGTTIGLTLPWALHYRVRRTDDDAFDSAASFVSRIAILPAPTDDGTGMTVQLLGFD